MRAPESVRAAKAETMLDRKPPTTAPASRRVLSGALLVLWLAACAPGAGAANTAVPSWLPHYEVDIDLDVAGHQARVRQQATWTNPHTLPATQLVFNAHARYLVPKGDVGFMAKTLEILRMDPGDSLGVKEPPLDVRSVTLLRPDAEGGPVAVEFRYEGPTQTALVVDLPHAVGQGQSVTVILDLVMHLPPKQGRWGQWRGVTFLSNWLPVFAFYGSREEGSGVRGQGSATKAAPSLPLDPQPLPSAGWQPTPFIPWHQPFFN